MLRHKPVLAQKIYELLPGQTGLVVDGTFGHGGHSEFILRNAAQTHQPVRVLALDRDIDVANKGLQRCADVADHLTFVQASYAQLPAILKERKLPWADFILLDLGVNMEHYKDPERGFSYQGDAPLDMRFDRTVGPTAAHRLATASKETLAQTFVMYADTPPHKAESLAAAILNHRKVQPFTTTGALFTFLIGERVHPKKIGALFQAIRITINNELNELLVFLDHLAEVLNPWGICCILTYHSIEDRLVKQKFKELAEDDKKWALLTKKAIKPDYREVQANKAARSAILRVIQFGSESKA